MKNINEKYNLNEEISNNFYKADSSISGEKFEILIFPNDETKNIKRIIDNNIKPLIDFKHSGIQKIIECEEDKKNNLFYIVYENIKTAYLEQTKYNLEQCINALDLLKKENRQGFLLNNDTVVLSADGEVKIRFVGLYELLGDGNKKNIKDDIKSLIELFIDYFYVDLDNLEAEKVNIYDKCINEGYTKYKELKEDLDDLPSEKNPDFDNIGIAVNSNNIDIDIEHVLKELNKGCYWNIKTDKSERDEVEIEWTTKNISGAAYVNYKYKNGDKNCGYLFIPYINNKPKEGLTELAKFNFLDDINVYCTIDFFYKKFEEVNQLARLHQQKKDNIKVWKTLPEQEKKYIEEKAFKAFYIEAKQTKNSLNINFILKDDFKNWEAVKDKKNDEVMLSIDEQYVGQILGYDQNSNRLTIKDVKVSIDEIPKQGQLIEDVQQETSQYKKQIEACEKLEKKDIVNQDLSAFIATPEKIDSLNHLDIDYEKFDELIINDKIKSDETQKQAVIDALHKKPIYLIQGPPGTGKTTVIVELIQQYILQKPDAKILVVSQSNLAVDNVLERLPKDILYMRLASSYAIDGDNIASSVKPHTFDEKLKTWISETKKNSEQYLNDKFSEANQPLLTLYQKFKAMKKPTTKAFQAEYRKLGLMRSYFEKIFSNAKNIEDIEPIFKKELGDDFIKLAKIQKDWHAFIQNSTTENTTSLLKNGSKGIDLKIALAKSMNVIGATCIHIASAQYNKIDFKFNYMIMDESSKATTAEALVAITMSKNIVLIGDHKQLPPVITREKEVKQKVKKELEDDGLDVDKTYGKSLFEVLIKKFEESHQLAGYQIMLDIQYRMPRQLGYLISKYIYDEKLQNPDIGKITDYDKDKSHKLLLKKPYIEIDGEKMPNSILFISTSKKEKPNDNGNKFKRQNSCNVETIQEVLLTLNKQYKNKEFDIGIIAGYRGQVELLKSKIQLEKYPSFKSKLDINTVDKFQGAERDIIIYDIVRSDVGNSNIGFLEDYRRINVAFSRAKKLLIIVGDSDYVLKRAKPNPRSESKKLVIKSMVEELDKWGCIYSSIEEAIK